MADRLRQDWPDRRATILSPTTTLVVFSTLFVLWRVINGIKANRKNMLCDYLLVIATILNIASIIVRYKTCQYGLGRHINDPSIVKPHDLLHYSYYYWIGQIINMIAITFLKYSICAYLLALKFSKVYLGIIWASIAIVTGFNLVVPMMSVFCRTPLEANWNKSIKGECFIKNGYEGLAWTQGASNIITDIVYVVAPIIYLSNIQISQHTQWGLRFMFCLGLMATVCSILKTIELPALMKTKDPTWDSTYLAMWSGIELSVGIFIASLPPLRKQFDTLFRKILPFTFLSSRSRSNGGNALPLYDVATEHTIGSKPVRVRLKSIEIDDEDSERCILSPCNSKAEITKTSVHEVRINDGSSIQVPDRTHCM